MGIDQEPLLQPLSIGVEPSLIYLLGQPNAALIQQICSTDWQEVGQSIAIIIFGNPFAFADSLACLERIEPKGRPGIAVSCLMPTGLAGSMAQVSRHPTVLGSASLGRAWQGYVLTSPCQGNHVSTARKGVGFHLQLDGLRLVLSRCRNPPGPLLPPGIRIKDAAFPLWALSPGHDRDHLPRFDG
jgi:hypothetical protein